MTKKLAAVGVVALAMLFLTAGKAPPPVYTFTAYNADGIGKANFDPNCSAAALTCYSVKDIALFAPTSSVTITKVQYMTSGHEAGAYFDGQTLFNGTYGGACDSGALLIVTDGTQLLGASLDTRSENADPQGGRLTTTPTNMVVGPNNPMRIYVKNQMPSSITNGVPNYCKGGAGNLTIYYTVN